MQLRHRHACYLPCFPAARVAVLVALILLATVQAPTGGLAAAGQPPGSTENQVQQSDPCSGDEALIRTVSFATAASPLAPAGGFPTGSR